MQHPRAANSPSHLAPAYSIKATDITITPNTPSPTRSDAAPPAEASADGVTPPIDTVACLPHFSELHCRAAQWECHTRAPEHLLKGPALQKALLWAKAHSTEINALERAFLAASQQAQSQAEQQQRQHHHAHWILLTLTLAGLLALGMMVFVWQHTNTSLHKNAIERSETLAQESATLIQTNGDHELAVLLALEAASQTQPMTDVALKALYQATQNSRWYTTLNENSKKVTNIAWHQTGDYLFTSSRDSHAYLWNTVTKGLSVTWPLQDTALHCAAWSHGQRRMVTAGADHSAKVWALNATAPFSPHLALTLTGHQDTIWHAAWSHDDRHIVTTSKDETARVWDSETGAEQARLLGHTAPVRYASWNPKSLRLITTDETNTALLWNLRHLRTNQPLTRHATFTLTHHGLPDTSVVWDNSGYNVITIGENNNAQIWQARTGQLRYNLSGHTAGLNVVAWRHDGKVIATGSGDSTVKLWKLPLLRQNKPVTLSAYTTITGPAAIAQLAWSHADNALAGIVGGKVYVWNPENGAPHFVIAEQSQIQQVTWHSEDTYIATANEKGTIKIWQAQTAQAALVLQHAAPIWQAIWSHTGNRIASHDAENTVTIWNAATEKRAVTLKATDPILSSAWSNNDKYLATGHSHGELIIWKTDSGEKHFTKEEHQDWIRHLAWSHDDAYLVTASDDGAAIIWDIRGERQHAKLGADNSPVVLYAAWNHDSSRLVTTHSNGQAVLWKADTGSRQLTLDHGGYIFHAAWNHDSQRLATASSDGTIKLWDTRNGNALQTLTGHQDRVLYLAWYKDRDTEHLLSASADGTARVWNIKKGKAHRVLKGHTNWVRMAVWSGDGAYIATASDDHTAKVWNAKTGKLLFNLDYHAGSVLYMAWHPEAPLLLTASADGTARIWPLDFSNWQKRACTLTGRDLTAEEWKHYTDKWKDHMKEKLTYEPKCPNTP